MTHAFDIRNSAFHISPVYHLAPQTALRDSAFLQCEAIPQVLSAAKDNMAGFVLANGPAIAGSSNQSGDCPARRAFPNAFNQFAEPWKATRHPPRPS